MLSVTLQNHLNNVSLVEDIAAALYNICCDENNRYKLGNAGACIVTKMALDATMTDPAAAEKLNQLIDNLALNESNCAELLALGTCESVFHSIHKHILNGKVIQKCCLAINSLLTHQPVTPKLRSLCEGCIESFILNSNRRITINDSLDLIVTFRQLFSGTEQDICQVA